MAYTVLLDGFEDALEETSAGRRHKRQRSQINQPLYAGNGNIYGISEAEFVQTGQTSQEIPVFAEESEHLAAESGMGG